MSLATLLSFLVKNLVEGNNVKRDEVLVPAMHSAWTDPLGKNLKPSGDAA